jgi:hypothetical protein
VKVTQVKDSHPSAQPRKHSLGGSSRRLAPTVREGELATAGPRGAFRGSWLVTLFDGTLSRKIRRDDGQEGFPFLFLGINVNFSHHTYVYYKYAATPVFGNSRVCLFGRGSNVWLCSIFEARMDDGDPLCP